MKIVVLVKQVPDTWEERRLDVSTGRVERTDGTQVVDETAGRAVEVALAHKDADRSTEVVCLTMGPAQARDALRTCLAMGADRAIHVVDDTLVGADARRTGAVLAAALRRERFGLLVAGDESTDGHGGVVPAILAEELGMPLLTSLTTVTLDAAAVTGTRSTASGTARVCAQIPAIVSVSDQLPEARLPALRGIFAAKRKPIVEVTAAELAADLPAATTLTLSAAERAARVAGRRVTDDGTAVGQLTDFLAARRLI